MLRCCLIRLGAFERGLPIFAFLKVKHNNDIDKIKAQIIVSAESQKGIIIGKGGAMLKKSGTEARKEIEEIAQNKVFLEIFVKVKRGWQKDENTLKLLGYEKRAD